MRLLRPELEQNVLWRACVACLVFFVWWSVWGMLDWALEPHAPTAHVCVLLASAVALGVYTCVASSGKDQQVSENIASM
jgi:hypothetical protein